MIRVAVAERLIALLKTVPALAGVTITDENPLTLDRESIALGAITGQSTPTQFGGPRVHTEDRFTIALIVTTRIPGRKAIEARRRCETIVAAIHETIRTDPSMRTPTPIVGLQHVVPDITEGPDVLPLEIEPGWESAAIVIISCFTTQR